MKNILAFSICLLLLIISSCVKEDDVIMEGEPEIIPQEGEIKLITGFVKDTSGMTISNASVKFVQGDLELLTEADENGQWNLAIPGSLAEAYIVANKVQYSKSIQRFTESENNTVDDIFLVTEQSNTTLNLSFDPNAIRTVIGRFIDGDGVPIHNIALFLFSILDNPENEVVFNGYMTSKIDGTFEFTYEDGDYSSTIIGALYSGGCADNITITLQGEDILEDLGDIELNYDIFSLVQTSLESDGSSCYDNVTTLSYVYDLENSFTENNINQPLGDISLNYCLGEDVAVYLGVESEGNAHFNGLFVHPSEVEPSYMFDICTPNPESFLEISINGNVELFEDDLEFSESQIVTYQTLDYLLNFRVQNWSIFTPLGEDSPAYQIGRLSYLNFVTLNNPFYSLDETTGFNYANVVQDDEDFFAGIVAAKISAENDSLVDVAIRFRVAK